MESMEELFSGLSRAVGEWGDSGQLREESLVESLALRSCSSDDRYGLLL